MSSIYRLFVKGLIAVLPISLSLYLVFWVTAKVDQFFGIPLQQFMGEHYFPGLGLALGLLVIFLVGVAVNNFISQKLAQWIESSILQIPFVKTVYGPLRDVMNLFGSQASEKMKRVVLVEVHGGVKILGLVTRDRFTDLKTSELNEYVAVFVPYSYALGGFTVLAHKSQVKEVDIPVEKAMQLAITAWVTSDRSSLG